jgi:hypothetical protein
MERGGQRPGLRAVDNDLDEPQRVRVLADPALLPAGAEVDPGDPLLVSVAFHRAGLGDAVGRSNQPLRDTASDRQ